MPRGHKQKVANDDYEPEPNYPDDFPKLPQLCASWAVEFLADVSGGTCGLSRRHMKPPLNCGAPWHPAAEDTLIFLQSITICLFVRRLLRERKGPVIISATIYAGSKGNTAHTMAISEARKGKRKYQTALIFTFAIVGTSIGRAAGGFTFIGILILLALILAAGPASAVVRQGRVKRTAANRRPGAVVIPAYTTGDLVDYALRTRVLSDGWGPDGGGPIALTVSDYSIEVWSGGEELPRISFRRADIQGAAVVQGEFGRKFGHPRSMKVIGLHTPTGTLTFVPAYQPIRNSFGSTPSGLTRALGELRAMGVGTPA